MELLTIATYILMASLIVFMFAAIRITTHKTIAMGLIGSATFSLGIAVLITAVGALWNIEFYSTIALALLIMGVVGTIAFSVVLKRGMHN
ncbi:MAG: hypothetical protein ACRCVG_01595 [Methanobacteriaceae archaeon]